MRDKHWVGYTGISGHYLTLWYVGLPDDAKKELLRWHNHLHLGKRPIETAFRERTGVLADEAKKAGVAMSRYWRCLVDIKTFVGYVDAPPMSTCVGGTVCYQRVCSMPTIGRV